MDTLQSIVNQEWIEEQYSRKHVDSKIRFAIEDSAFMQCKVSDGIHLVKKYMEGSYYEAKMNRIAQLADMDIAELVMDIYVGIAYFQREELFTSVTAQLASRLKFSDKTAAITTVAELVAVLCQTDVFDISKSDKSASLMVVSRIPLEDSLVRFIECADYLPPMLCEPMELTHNYSSGYLTHNDSLILGTGNHHDGDLCLDVLNLMNKVPLKLNTKFLSTVEEVPNHVLETPEQEREWYSFKATSYKFYALLVEKGNRFFLTHKPDKRGRIYASGYHITTQGTSFKKASLEFSVEELVEGVPTN